LPHGTLNKARNPDFALGASVPRHWEFASSTKTAGWERTGDPRVMRLIARSRQASVIWSQTVRCKPKQHYRIELRGACDLRAGSESAGLVLTVEPQSEGRRGGASRSTPGLHHASNPVTVRTYYETPPDIKELRISVGIVNARGTADLHRVRVMEILEPEHASHVLAVPPPPLSLPAPKAARTAVICTDAGDRTVVRLLSMVLGEANVSQVSAAKFRPQGLSADAVLLPDDKPPRSIRSLKTLKVMAADRIVVISLAAFAKLAGPGVSLRRVEQEDDPIHATVAYAGWPTRGFALRDAFPYAWCGDKPGSFVQRHFKRTAAMKAFCKKHGFTPLLTSLCDRDVTSYRPAALYRPTQGGGLFVLDIDPIEHEGSTFCEPAAAMVLLLNVLGRHQVCLGQYVVPQRSAAEFRTSIREMAERFDPFVVHDEDVPNNEVTDQLVTIGREGDSFGLPLKSKPLILVRSGLAVGDMESVYGALTWFKQFVRMEPYECPYAARLASRFRFAWVPLCADWEPGDGWRRSGDRTGRAKTLFAPNDRTGKAKILFASNDTTGKAKILFAPCGTGDSPVSRPEDAELAALIDVVSTPVNRVRVVVPSLDGEYQRYATWLPALAEAFGAGDYFAPTVARGERCSNRDAIAWRRQTFSVEVAADPTAFDRPNADVRVRSRVGFHDPVVHCATQAGAQVLRLELPAHQADFPAHSIRLTDTAATLLEHVIGLQYGLLAVNRRPTPAHLDAFPPVAPGEMLAIPKDDPALRALATPTG